MPRASAASKAAAAASASDGVKGGKVGKKTSGMPKKATTSYFAFTADKRDEVKRKNPDLKMTEHAKILGDMWRKMSDKDKKPYMDMVEKDKKRYEQEMELYHAGKFVSN